LPIAAAGAAVLVVLTPILTVASSTAAYVAACQSPADSGDFNGVDAVDLASFQGTPLGAALAALPKAKNSESRLQGNTALMLRLTEKLWPYYGRGGNGTIGGYREDAMPYHPSGQALDVMMPGDARDAKGVRLGNTIAAFYKTNAAALGIEYIVWRQKIWNIERASEGWRTMSDNGSWTANHMDHVHLNVYGSRVPKGTLKLPAGAALPAAAPATSAAAAPATGTADSIVWPVGKGAIGGLHPVGGRDMGRTMGHPVVAAHSGTVTESTDLTDSYGRYVQIEWKTGQGRSLGNTYAHLRSRSVQKGQKVTAGQLIGYVGSTGNSSGPHLHFELYSGSGSRTGLDPLPWLQDGKEPALDGLPADPAGPISTEECEAAGGIPNELPEFGGSGPYTDSAAPMRGVGVAYSPKEAAARLVKWASAGTGGYAHQCLRLADDAYGGSERVGRAIDQWYRAKAAGYAHPKDKNPPIGAQLFWWTNNDARHIATYVGGGKVVTNVTSEGGAVKLLPASELDTWGPYLGWAEPYYSS
jgi:hypothetical protein